MFDPAAPPPPSRPPAQALPTELLPLPLLCLSGRTGEGGARGSGALVHLDLSDAPPARGGWGGGAVGEGREGGGLELRVKAPLEMGGRGSEGGEGAGGPPLLTSHLHCRPHHCRPHHHRCSSHRHSPPPADSGAAAELTAWPEFHNGCAAGLRLAPSAGGGEGGGACGPLSRSWLMHQRPEAPSYAHAGLLMALGLTGHLRRLSWTDLYRWGGGAMGVRVCEWGGGSGRACACL